MLPSLQTHFPVASSERVIVPCPIQPGALIQQYSAKWTKDDNIIASSSNSQSVDNSPYEIDRATYSLIIDSVSTNDTSTDYQCELSVTNPITNTRQKLRQSQVSLSLSVIDLSVANALFDVLQWLQPSLRVSHLLKLDGKNITMYRLGLTQVLAKLYSVDAWILDSSGTYKVTKNHLYGKVDRCCKLDQF